MKDPTKVKELIIEKLSLAEVMLSYGVPFAYDPRQASEVQYRCPFHGKDTKPSARLYNTTKSCFCWVCRKTWNVVSFIMEKENLQYRAALLYIINRFKIDISSIPDRPTWTTKPKPSEKNISLRSLQENILNLKHKISFEKYRSLCSTYFMIKNMPEQDVVKNANLIKEKILCLQKSTQ